MNARTRNLHGGATGRSGPANGINIFKTFVRKRVKCALMLMTRMMVQPHVRIPPDPAIAEGESGDVAGTKTSHKVA